LSPTCWTNSLGENSVWMSAITDALLARFPYKNNSSLLDH
jgi:hypothetical protein